MMCHIPAVYNLVKIIIIELEPSHVLKKNYFSDSKIVMKRAMCLLVE